MAKQTHDREDLIRDGTAMGIRGQFYISDVEVVVGFRSSGQMSLYWGQDPVFQFDEQKRLRRAFVDATRLKAEGGKLCRLTQKPAPQESKVNRLRLTAEPLSESEQRVILERLRHCLQQIHRSLSDEEETSRRDLSLRCSGGSEKEFVTLVRRWLSDFDPSIPIADGPSA